MFVSKARVSPSDTPINYLDTPTSIKRNGLPGTNTLAYYDHSKITDIIFYNIGLMLDKWTLASTVL